MPSWNGLSYGINNYGLEATFNAMTSLLNFMEIYQLVQRILRGRADTGR
jgi:hypothetical protein